MNQKETLRRSLVESVQTLDATVDDQWRTFLALPASVQSGVGPVDPAELNAAVARYDRIQSDAKYAVLAKMPQFTNAYSLLKKYAVAKDAAPRNHSDVTTTAEVRSTVAGLCEAGPLLLRRGRRPRLQDFAIRLQGSPLGRLSHGGW